MSQRLAEPEPAERPRFTQLQGQYLAFIYAYGRIFKRPPAEVLYDMVCQSTGVPERFAGSPAGTRAIQLWDSKVDHYFLKAYGPAGIGSKEILISE